MKIRLIEDENNSSVFCLYVDGRDVGKMSVGEKIDILEWLSLRLTQKDVYSLLYALVKVHGSVLETDGGNQYVLDL